MKSIFFLALLINISSIAQTNSQLCDRCKDAEIIIKNPVCDINEMYFNHLQFLIEVKNNSTIDLCAPKFIYNNPKEMYGGLKSDMIKPGASLFYLAKLDPQIDFEKSSLLYSTFFPKGRETVSPHPRNYHFEAGEICNKSGYSYSICYCSKFQEFNNSISLVNNTLFFLDTTLIVSDSSEIKKMNNAFHVIDNIFIMVDTITSKDRLAEIKLNSEKNHIIPFEDIEVQNKRFYYKDLKINNLDFDSRLEYLFVKSDTIQKVICHFTLTNNSNHSLYIKNDLNENIFLKYKLGYFSYQIDTKNIKKRVLIPGGTIILSMVIDKTEIGKKYIKINTDQIFFNCEKGKIKIQFTEGYNLD